MFRKKPFKKRSKRGAPGDIGRVRVPHEGEVICLVESMLGNNKMRVRCQDEKIRMARIPGKLRKRIWMHEGEFIILRPWDIQGDTNGDAIWKYSAAQVDWLRRRGILTMEV